MPPEAAPGRWLTLAPDPAARLAPAPICEREYEARRHGALPCLPGRHLLAVLLAGRALCQDLCKPDARLSGAVARPRCREACMPQACMWAQAGHRAGPVPADDGPVDARPCWRLLASVYRSTARSWAGLRRPRGGHAVGCAPDGGFLEGLCRLAAGAGAVVAWWVVLTHKSRQGGAGGIETARPRLLCREIESHRRTDEASCSAPSTGPPMQRPNQAKSRYISTISHELRTPLNSILGYAQLLDEDDEPSPRTPARPCSVIKRGGDHLLSLIEGTLDIARIESGKLTLERARRCALPTMPAADRAAVRAAGAGPSGIGFRRIEIDAHAARGRGARRREAAAPDPASMCWATR